MLRGATQNVLEAFHHDLNKGKLKYDHVVLLVESFETRRARGHALNPSGTVRNTIRLNSDYLQQYDGDLRREFAGLLYHESTRVWQNDGKGRAPRGLLTGIADYMRLKAGYPAKTWRSRGSGLRWDEGFEVTAYFLEYCDGIRGVGDDFVSELNTMMKKQYSDEYFYRLMGRSVGELWVDYVKYFQSGKRESEYNQHMGNLAAKKLRGSVKLITFEAAVTY
ncbi:hypothetical protein MLD38_007970 [Melastoma candidum]|uniref:Uncharacterized protein n=1 Tax=Melastoma candidum TaxID=119954 RepID=A0ACB9RST8_9MYRT|nr:hypothetical protein MLD38_007970 [Melastoma candidum]